MYEEKIGFNVVLVSDVFKVIREGFMHRAA